MLRQDRKISLLCIILLTLMTGGVSHAAPRSVRGTVCDSLSRETLPGVVIEAADTGGKLYGHAVASESGTFIVGPLPEKEVVLRFSMLGYKTKSVTVPNGTEDTGPVYMKPDETVLDAAVHREQAIRTTQSGDTIVYNAAAYRTMMGASSEDLIAKMPGISVSANEVEANGKKVRRVMVDGREYFDDDVMTALRNIPSDMISEVEVLNKMSDEAEMTSISDGNDYTAINIVTKDKGARGSVAGKFYGGYGIPDKYIAGAGVNYFGKEHTATLLLMSNNVNRYNLVSGDLAGASDGDGTAAGSEFSVKPLAGVSSVHSAGASYSGKTVNASYSFNRIDNGNISRNTVRRATGEGMHQLQTNGTDFRARNNIHRFSAKITPLPKGSHSLIVRPSITFQDLYDARLQETGLREVSGTDTLFKRNRLLDSDNNRWNVNARLSAVYRYRFRKPGRNISVSASGNYYRYAGLEHSAQFTFRDEDSGFDREEADASSGQYRDRNNENWSVSSGITYTEPLSRRSRLAADYKFNCSSASGGNMTYLHDKQTGGYSPEADPKQSSVLLNVFITNTAGVRYNYVRKKMTVTAGVSYQHVCYNGQSEMTPVYETDRHFGNILYNIVASLPFNSRHSLRLEARSRTQNPSVSMMQSSVNLNNPGYVRSGNPDIVPSYLNNLEARYIHTNTGKGSTVSLSLNFSGSANYMCDSLVVDSPDFEVAEGVKLGDGNQFVKPVNLPGYYRLTGRVTYGFPVRFISSNMNVNASATVSSIPGMINADKIPVRRNAFAAGLRLDSNISENLDFSVSYTAQYVNNEYSGRYGVNRNNYFTHTAKGSLKWIFLHGFTFTGSVSFKQNLSLTGLYNDKMVYCDLFLGRKLFRNKAGEVSVGVNDLLNATKNNYRHTINATGTSDYADTGIGRYFSIRLVYHLRCGINR